MRVRPCVIFPLGGSLKYVHLLLGKIMGEYNNLKTSLQHFLNTLVENLAETC